MMKWNLDYFLWNNILQSGFYIYEILHFDIFLIDIFCNTTCTDISFLIIYIWHILTYLR